MNDYVLSFLLGVIEGLTEFLPVSSTAHLRLSEVVLGIHLDDPFWKMYTIFIQLGAILSLPIYFRTRIAKTLESFRPRNAAIGVLILLFWLPFSLFCLTAWMDAFRHVTRPASKPSVGDPAGLNHLLTLVIVAFVVTAVPSWALNKVIGANLESLRVMGWSLLIGGIVMWVVDARFGHPPASGHFKTEHMEEMSLPQAIWIGFCQIFSAVFPGTSRSMSTIVAGQLAGMSRPSALEFSFFLSMPTMGAATLYLFYKTLHAHAQETALGRMPVNAQEWITLTIGFVVSFIVALGVVAWFMHWVRRRGFIPFAVYRIALGAVVLVWVFRGGHGS